MRKIIGVWGISNTASLNVYEVELEYGEPDRLLVGINDEEPEWCDVVENEESDEFELGIMFGEIFYRLDECMTV